MGVTTEMTTARSAGKAQPAPTRITAHTTQTQEAHLLAGNAAQIIGKVNPDLSIKVLSSMDLGTKVGKSSHPVGCLHLYQDGVVERRTTLP